MLARWAGMGGGEGKKGGGYRASVYLSAWER